MINGKKALRLIIIVLAGVVIGLIGWRVGRSQKHLLPTTTLNPNYGSVKDFSFTDQSGKSFGLKDLKGKIWIADFVFTRCMGPCPLLTTRMAEIQKEFRGKKNLFFVSFTVDPDFDTPEVLAKYASSYEANTPNWRFLTGPKEKVYGLIRESFHLAVEESPPEKPSINDILHSLYFVLVDENGTIIGYFNSGEQESLKKLRDALTNT